MALDWEFVLLASIPFGLLLGSFLNVCIFRLPRECMSIVRPRSRCVTCLRPIHWYENVPVLSYAFLRGKCAGCGARISLRYPLVELLTAGLVALIVWTRLFPAPNPADPFDRWVLILAQVYVAASLIAATFIDFEFRILPDSITKTGIVTGVLASAAFPILHRHEPIAAIANPHLSSLVAAALGALTGGGLILVVRVVGSWIFRKEAMGEGDIYYMAFIGSFLGWKAVLLTFFLGCLIGSVYGIAQLVITRDRYVPFGPFLSLGALVMMIFPEWIFAALAWWFGLFGPR